MNRIYTICYVSKSDTSLDETSIEKIFEKSWKYNNSCDISGVLLYSFGNFFQVLEGNEESLLELYEKIKNDERHDEIFEVYHGTTAHPIFLKYKSKFNVLKTLEDLKAIYSYLEMNKSHLGSDKLKRLLQPFLMMYEADDKQMD
ncbi:BLUF domain-containing protein [Nonlabens marinus]|uniref:BLUF domain-containing protein n=1 Tax=Nonlabens marinus S1-08 TaxID=1454201 RepID=W8VMX0_9FLAO|nr:BLUF domain-containing protein [Nonlabens marinus]BAO54104.1 hypothetical protein NMS_0095 [Nonlabens marinus S1-08]